METHSPSPAAGRRDNLLRGRRVGKALSGYQRELMNVLLPRLAMDPSRTVEPETLFARPVLALDLEIGFGGGEHLAAQAAARPATGFIGCEPFLNGVVQALAHLRDANDGQGLANVRLHRGDALDVLERLPDASLSRAYLLHPDPWPKARHAKRRMVNHGPLDLLAAKLKPGAEFRLGTDDPTYCRWATMVMGQRGDFRWTAARAADFLERPADWPETRYERKARRHGHEVWYFRYVRV